MLVNFENIVPIIFRDGNLIVNRQGDITICYRFSGVPLGSKTEEELDTITNRFSTAFSFLPDNVVVHKQDVFIHKNMYTQYDTEKDFFLRAYLKLYDKTVYLDHTSYLFVTLTEGLSLQRNYSLARTGKDIAEISLDKDDYTMRKRIDNFLKQLEGYKRFMSDSNMKLIPLTEEETDASIEGYFSLYDNTLTGDIDFNDFTIGNKKFNTVSVSNGEQLPDEVTAARLHPDFARFAETVTDIKGTRTVGIYADFLCSLTMPLNEKHVVNQIFFCDGKNFWKSEIERRKNKFHVWRQFSEQNNQMANSIKEFEKDSSENNQTIVRCHINVTYWSEGDISQTTEALRSKFKELGMTGHVSNKYDIRHIFMASSPGNAGTMPFEETFIAHASAVSALAIKENSGVDVKNISDQNEKGLLFTDRMTGSLVKRDCWHKPYESKLITNRNWLGVGQSGSGKSSMTIEIIRQYLQMGFCITVMDIGRSFEVLAKSHNGNYIIYEDGMSLGINPYAFEGHIMSNSQLEFLGNFTAVLWRPNSEFSDDEMNALERVILASYGGERDHEKATGFLVNGDFSNASIKNLFDFVQKNQSVVKELTKNKVEFFDIDSFLLSIEKFVDGKFDRLLTGNKESFIDLNNPLTVWELDNIKDHPTLFPIVSMLITYLTTEVIWKKTSVDKIVLIEEAWKILEKEGMAMYVKWLYKTVRKFNGGVGINIQQIDDINIAKTNIKSTILANSAVKYIMSHSVPMAKELARELDWDDQKLGMLLSIPLDEQKASGKRFSELVSIVGSDIKCLRLQVSKEQIVNFMSEMKEKTELFEIVKQFGGNWKKGISEYAKTKM